MQRERRSYAASGAVSGLALARRKGQHDRRIQGHSYPQAWYEDAVGTLLGEVGGLDDLTITEAV